jgi:hypothetical protein
MTQANVTTDWSAARKFNSKLVGYIRGGELYDPLIHGETVGVRVGSTDFIPGKGIRLNDNTSYVKYLLPGTISTGEFSMEVEGLRPDAPGNKSKVFGMQEGQDDFIVNRYRVDAQYRGSGGSPPNAITWRAMFGSDDEKLEPDTAVRYASVFALVPARPYLWRGTWSNSGFRLEVLDGGLSGSALYNRRSWMSGSFTAPTRTTRISAHRPAGAERSRRRFPAASTGTCTSAIVRALHRLARLFRASVDPEGRSQGGTPASCLLPPNS